MRQNKWIWGFKWTTDSYILADGTTATREAEKREAKNVSITDVAGNTVVREVYMKPMDSRWDECKKCGLTFRKKELVNGVCKDCIDID